MRTSFRAFGPYLELERPFEVLDLLEDDLPDVFALTADLLLVDDFALLDDFLDFDVVAIDLLYAASFSYFFATALVV